MRLNSWCAALAFGTAAFTSGQVLAQGNYAVTELTGFPANNAYAVNLTNSGQLTFYQQPLDIQFMRWTAGSGVETLQVVPLPLRERVVDQNEAGQVLWADQHGMSLRNADGSYASSGGVSTLGGLGEQGAVVGSVFKPSLTLNPTPGNTTVQRAGDVPVVYFQGSGTIEIPSLAETVFYVPGPNSYPVRVQSMAYGINGLGQVVGTDGASVKGVSNAFLWSQQAGTESLGRLAGYASATARDINNAGLVVGTSTVLYAPPSEWDGAHAFIWTREGGMRDLNDLLSADDVARGVVALSAIDVNDRGDILTWIQGDGVRRLALLSAVPEPGTSALMGLGLIGVAMAARRRHSVAEAA